MNNKKNINNGILGEIKVSPESMIKEWQKLHFGMFIHLGLYSYLGGNWNGQPIREGYSEQIQMWANITGKDYEQIASNFALEEFDPEAICELAKEAGMKYIVITSKHHDGFCMFDTKTTDYNVVDSTPFGKDVLKLLSDECYKQGLKFGIYFSLIDWHEGHNFDPNNNNNIPATMEPLIENQLTELMTNYGQICEVWFDMSSPTKEQSVKFKKIVRKFQPNAAINGRIWNNESDFRTLDDNQIPLNNLEGAWQTPASIYHATWGYRSWQVRDDFKGKVQDLLESLIAIRARGGNYLLNIGPDSDGSIVNFEADVLQEMGKWIKRYPTAILDSSPTKFSDQSWGEITCNDTELFLHVFNKPKSGKIKLSGLSTQVNKVVEDSSDSELDWSKTNLDIEITLPTGSLNEVLTVLRVELDDKLYIVPNKVVTEKEDGLWVVSDDDIYYGYNYADEGNYNSLIQTNVRQTFYLSNVLSGKIAIEFYGSINSNLTYTIKVGSEVKELTGKEMINSKNDSYTIDSKHTILPVHITLSNPQHKYKDLELKLDHINVHVTQ